MALVSPHGPARRLAPALLTGEAAAEGLRRAAGLVRVPMTSREVSDLIMLGIGGYTPLPGFMGEADARRVCEEFRTADGVFWPIPITLSAARDLADRLRVGQDVALVDEESGEVMGTLTIAEKYRPDRLRQCKHVFRTTDTTHPGVAGTLAEGEINLAGPVTVFGEGPYPARYPGLYLVRTRHARSSRPRAGARWRLSSCATPCIARTSTWPRSPSRSVTAS